MDHADIAARNGEQVMNLLLGERKKHTRTESRETCIECEKTIPLARREAAPGCQLCIECQKEYERRAR